MTRIAPHTRERAKSLRKSMTHAERRLWAVLRSANAAGLARFRRQAPIGPFIVDFVDFRAGLVVEVDGGPLAGSPNDARRDAWLASQGFRVFRVWNHEVMRDADAVADAAIRAASEKRKRVL